SIYPTPVIGVLGVLDDASRVLKIAFRGEGDAIVLLDGNTSSACHSERSEESAFLDSESGREFSSSEYSKTIAAIVSGEPAAIDLAAEKRLIDCLVALAAEGAVQSAHDISDGGLAVTLVESCFASAPVAASSSVGAQHAPPLLGAIVSLEDASFPAEVAPFGERGARAVL